MSEPIPEQDTQPVTNPPPPEAPQSEPDTKPPFIAFVDHQLNAAQEALDALRGLLPLEFRTHARAARREFLMSFQVLLEGVSERIDEEMARARQAKTDAAKKSDGDDDDDKPSTTGKSKVKIDVM